MTELLIRFVGGGIVVGLFAMVGDVVKPKTFAGLFGAAPSVALASLGLTVAKHGSAYAALECRSMLLGAVALAVYASVVCWMLIRSRKRPLAATLWAMPAWFAVAFGACFVFFR